MLGCAGDCSTCPGMGACCEPCAHGEPCAGLSGLAGDAWGEGITTFIAPWKLAPQLMEPLAERERRKTLREGRRRVELEVGHERWMVEQAQAAERVRIERLDRANRDLQQATNQLENELSSMESVRRSAEQAAVGQEQRLASLFDIHDQIAALQAQAQAKVDEIPYPDMDNPSEVHAYASRVRIAAIEAQRMRVAAQRLVPGGSPGSLSPAAIQHLGGLGFMGGLGGINDPDPEDEPGLYDRLYAWAFGQSSGPGMEVDPETGYPVRKVGVFESDTPKYAPTVSPEEQWKDIKERYTPDPGSFTRGLWKVGLALGGLWLAGRFIEGLGKGVGGRR